MTEYNARLRADRIMLASRLLLAAVLIMVGYWLGHF